MSVFSTGAKVLGKALSPAEKAASDFVKGVSRIIPSETKTGQTSLFMPSDYKPAIPKRTPQGGPGLGGIMSTPPFKGGGRFVSGDPRAAVKGLARTAELRAKKKAEVKAAVAEISAVREQSGKLVKAVNSGNATPMEAYKGMGILNNRMSRVTSSLPKSSFNPKASAAKAAIKQQDKMDVAKAAGQITDREIMKTNKILMKRRKAAGI